MKDLLFLTSTSQPSTSQTSESGGTMERLLEIFKNPIFYIIVGAFAALIIIVYFLRRFVRANPGQVVIVTRRGKVRKILNENDKIYYRAPFVDAVGAIISLSGNEFTSDKLFVNNGPDHLYRFNYTLLYNVTNPELFYKNFDGIQEKIEKQINDSLRFYVDQGNASKLINDYRSEEKNILSVINESINQFGAVVASFKVNYIEPIGR